MDRQLVFNAIKTPDGKVLVSYHHYDYKTYTDSNSGEEYMVDGGLEYLRRNLNTVPYEELSVYSDESFEKVRQYFHWGSNGKYQDQMTQYRPLCELTTEHINAIIDNGFVRDGWIKDLFLEELEYRFVNPFGNSDIDIDALADIRNKLTPIKNVLALVNRNMNDLNTSNLKELLIKELENANDCVDYISKLGKYKRL